MLGYDIHSSLAFAATVLLSSHAGVASARTPTSSDTLGGSKASIHGRAATSCNGSPLLCDRRYDSVTYMGAHDSAFVRDASTNNSIAGNQYFPATRALDDGIRLLQAQTHDLDGVVELCHTSCDLLDAGPLENWLAGIKTWLDGHPDEVVTMLLVNSGGNDAADFGKVFDAAGLGQYGYVPPSPSSASSSSITWPTLGDMITTDKRLVVFIASISANPTYPYLLSEFEYVFETPYAVTTATGFNCTLDRPAVSGEEASAGTSSSSSSAAASAAIKAGKLALMNHFRYNTIGTGGSSLGTIMFPDSQDVAVTNSPDSGLGDQGSLGAHADLCVGEWDGQKPVFVLVDFYSEGPAMGTGDRLNGVSRDVGSSGSGSGSGSASGEGQAQSSPSGSPASTSGSSSAAATTTTTTTTLTGNGSGGGSGLDRDNGVAFGLVVFLVGALVMI